MRTEGQSIDGTTVVTIRSAKAAHCGCVDPRGMRGGRLHLPTDGRATLSKSSRISGFYKRTPEERLEIVAEFAGLDDDEVAALRGGDSVRLEAADKMIENVVGLFHFPAAFAANFRVDGVDRLVPMVIEEPSVVAASSNAANLLRDGEGIQTTATAPLMIGQIQLCEVPDLEADVEAIEHKQRDLIQMANDAQPRLVARGGGARSLEVRRFEETELGPMLVVHLLVDVCDAMGANLVNGMVETLAPEIEKLSGANAYLRILSNLADKRLVHATGRVPLSKLERPKLGLSGADVADRIVRASIFAEIDPYRAATHNKGIMNGVDAFLLATGQDWRAVEAGAHAYFARPEGYTAMATWRREGDHLVGKITLPMQVGIVGGVVKVHPVVRVMLKVLGAERASDVGRIAASVGLAQNLAAIMALATEGIQRGHMSLHARNIAAAAGARAHEIDSIVAEMIRRRSINEDAARSILDESKTEGESEQRPFTVDDFRAARDRMWPGIEALLESVTEGGERPGSLGAMVKYQLGTGGKRLRAVIPLLVHEALGGDPERAVPFAAALELLHNAMLIHDDAENRVRTRRGHDTLWVRYGLDQAITCGDGMVYLALTAIGHLPHPADQVRRLERLLTRRMLKASEAQVRALHRDRTVDAWLDLTRDRTGGLFSLAMAGGALLAGADDALVEALEALGRELGITFQVQDELLDLLGGERRERGSDIADGQMGLLIAHCLQVAPPEDADRLLKILHSPRIQTDAPAIDEALRLLEVHGSIAFGAELIQEHRAQVERLAESAPVVLQRLLRGLTDVFLNPLVNRVSG